MNDPHLSPREKETLELVKEGRSDKEICGAMGISYSTLRARFMKPLFKKFQVSSRTQLVSRALRLEMFTAMQPSKRAEAQA